MATGAIKNDIFQLFQNANSILASVIGHSCSLKPEVAILLDLFEAEREGRLLNVSAIGLTSGIPQSTALRYIAYLEEQGWITRSSHRTDKRVQYLRLSPQIFRKLREVFEDCPAITESAFYRPAA